MIYFIPAWYKDNKWCENEQCWYVKRVKSEFDDTVKQIQLFHRNHIQEYQILLLGFTPNLRHFLHRQSVFHAPYWSCFDAIQQVRKKKAAVFSFHSINWPKGIEFVYTPFAVFALLNGQKYAQIEFGEDGNPIQIDMYESGIIVRRNIYDDRGFVSSTIVYESGKPVYQDYLMENGIWKVRDYLDQRRVLVNPKYSQYLIEYAGEEYTYDFIRTEYESIDQIVQEVAYNYVLKTSREDIFCVAMHNRHTKVLCDVLDGKKVILSYFENRYEISDKIYNDRLLNMAGYVITDSKDNSNKVRVSSSGNVKKIIDITPYDTRIDFGISQQLSVKKLLVPVDGLNEKVFGETVISLAEYVLSSEKIEIHFLTRQANPAFVNKIESQTRQVLAQNGFDVDMASFKKNDQTKNQIDIDATEEIQNYFYVQQCVDELSVSNCMREQRLLIDVRDMPDVYLQISALSMGIPQIVKRGTQFVEHEKNGYIINGANELLPALAYYLDGMNHWNEAMIYSYELGRLYTTDVLIQRWKEVISSFE